MRTLRLGGDAIVWQHGHGSCWLRVFGYGVSVKDSRRTRLLFSERMGLRGLRVGPLVVSWLPRWSI